MQTIWQEIKVGRLMLAVIVTLLVADVVPHPNLSLGFLGNALQRTQGPSVKAAPSNIANLGGAQ